MPVMILSTFVLLQLGTLLPGQRLLQGPATAASVATEVECTEARSALPPVLPALHHLQPQAQLCQNVQGPANPRNAAGPAHATALMAVPSWPLAAQARIHKMHTGPTLFLACRQTAPQRTAATYISKCTALLAQLCGQASLPCHAMQVLNPQHATGPSQRVTPLRLRHTLKVDGMSVCIRPVCIAPHCHTACAQGSQCAQRYA